MASRKTLNAKNLEALGVARLAGLLIEVSAGDAAIKRRLRLELAGPAEVGREIGKRLTSIARARSFIDWQKRKAFVADLETQRRAIIEQVAETDPAEALDLLWRSPTQSLIARMMEAERSSGSSVRRATTSATWPRRQMWIRSGLPSRHSVRSPRTTMASMTA